MLALGVLDKAWPVEVARLSSSTLMFFVLKNQPHNFREHFWVSGYSSGAHLVEAADSVSRSCGAAQQRCSPWFVASEDTATESFSYGCPG